MPRPPGGCWDCEAAGRLALGQDAAAGRPPGCTPAPHAAVETLPLSEAEVGGSAASGCRSMSVSAGTAGTPACDGAQTMSLTRCDGRAMPASPDQGVWRLHDVSKSTASKEGGSSGRRSGVAGGLRQEVRPANCTHRGRLKHRNACEKIREQAAPGEGSSAVGPIRICSAASHTCQLIALKPARKLRCCLAALSSSLSAANPVPMSR
jgi:hypothetical protein